jgi:guanylate kinase
MRLPKPGRIVIISSPSGGGKTSICRRLLTSARKHQGWTFSVSYTTRAKRTGERHGREYYFVGEAQFDRLAKKNFFAEHFRVHLYNYGTPRKPLEDVRRRGGTMVLDVDVNGAFRLLKEYPDAVTIFVLPPSILALRQRLRRRGTETKEQLHVRFKNAIGEMKLYRRFEYVVINEQLDDAVRDVLSIVRSHRCRVDHLPAEQIRRIVG